MLGEYYQISATFTVAAESPEDARNVLSMCLANNGIIMDESIFDYSIDEVQESYSVEQDKK